MKASKNYKMLIKILLAGLSFNCFAGTLNLAGNYVCEGYDPFEKSNYKVNVTVRKTNDTYTFEGNEEGKPTHYTGTAVFNKAKPNVLAVVSAAQDSKNYYIALFEANEKGELQGNWSKFGSDQVSTEHCKKQ